MKRHLQSAAVLLCAALLTACALSPAAPVRRQPPPGAYPANADEALWAHVDAAWDKEMAHRTTITLQRQPWWDGEIILFTYEDNLPEWAGGGRQQVLSWVLTEPDPIDAGWTVVMSGNEEVVRWPWDQPVPIPAEICVYSFWLSERQDDPGRTMSVIYGLWDTGLGEAPPKLELALDSASREVSLVNDSFLYVAEGYLADERPQITWDCGAPDGSLCGIGVYSDELPDTLEPLVFADQIRSHAQTLDSLTGQLVPFTVGRSDPKDPFAPGTLTTPAQVHFSLHWQVLPPPSADWRVFVHLLNEAGDLVLQSDAAVDWPAQPCADGQYGPECTVASEHEWAFPAGFPTGLYTITVGLYDPATGARAPITSPPGATSSFSLGQVWVTTEDKSNRQEIETALATLFVNDPTGRCGWEVLGETDQEMYVWAVCQSGITAVSAPAVIHLAQDETGFRSVQDVEMPRDGSFYGEDVRALFPPEVQARIFASDVDAEATLESINTQVTLGIFSGRPDPTWTIDPVQETQLRQQINLLPPTQEPFDNTIWLPSGYHGFTVRLPAADGQPSQLVEVYQGVVQVETEGRVVRMADEDWVVERWLLDTAGGHVEEDIIEAIREDLDAAAPATTTRIVHVIQEGDTVLSIAARYGTSMDAILAANALDDVSLLKVGQEMLIPVSTETSDTIPLVNSVSLTICQSSDTWTRPSEAEQAAEVWNTPRRQDIPREMLWWSYQQSFYRYLGGNSEMFDAWPGLGLWTAEEPYVCQGDRIGDIATGREIELWVLLYRVVAARRQGGEYTLTVEPAPAGYQVVRLPGPGTPDAQFIVRFVDTEGYEIDHLPKFPPWADPAVSTARDVVTGTGTVADNALSAQVVTLEDADGATWYLPWMDGTIVRRADGTHASFRDITRGMTLVAAGFRCIEAVTPNTLSAVRVDILAGQVPIMETTPVP